MVVGIVADNREQAIETLHKRQKNVKSIERIFMGDQIHVISDHIMSNSVQNDVAIKVYKKEIQYLKNLLMDSDDEIKRLQELSFDAKPQVAVGANEIEILHEKIVDLEMEIMELRGQNNLEKPKASAPKAPVKKAPVKKVTPKKTPVKD